MDDFYWPSIFDEVDLDMVKRLKAIDSRTVAYPHGKTLVNDLQRLIRVTGVKIVEAIADRRHEEAAELGSCLMMIQHIERRARREAASMN